VTAPHAIFDRQAKWHNDFSIRRDILSTWMPTRPGILYFTWELAGPLVAEVK